MSPAFGFGVTAQDIQQRRLARSVGTDQAHKFTLLDFEADIVDSGQAAVALHNAAN